MFSASGFNWIGLFLLLLLWVGMVAVAFWLLDRLFPRIRRELDDRTATPLGPAPPLAEGIAQARPARAVAEAAPVAIPAAPPWLAAYWQATLRLIAPLLLFWLLSFALPAMFVAQLNQVQIFTGFPLGYYMGAQGSLIIFLLLIGIYIWRTHLLDRRYNLDLSPSDPEQQRFRRRLLRGYGLFTLLLVGLVLLLITLELAAGLPGQVIGWIFLLFTMGIYAVIGLRARSTSLDEYYVAGRRVPGVLNGLATGSDWMSAASFISMAGALWVLGYEGLAYILGWTGGYVLLALLLAPYLRKFGQYTVCDFVGARYEGSLPRLVAAVITIIICFTYVTAQVTGVGIIMSRFLGVNYFLGVVFGLAAVLLCSVLGGMQAVTWTQVAQGIIMVLAYLVPVTWLSLQLTGVPLPQLMYGQALAEIEQLEAAQGIAASYLSPFNDWSPWHFLALVLCLMFGTAGMPHILVRFYTVPGVRDSRRSVGWALAWICLIYFTAPAYAAFARWEMLQDVVGRPVAELPTWTTNWAQTGLLTIAGGPGGGPFHRRWPAAGDRLGSGPRHLLPHVQPQGGPTRTALAGAGARAGGGVPGGAHRTATAGHYCATGGLGLFAGCRLDLPRAGAGHLLEAGQQHRGRGGHAQWPGRHPRLHGADLRLPTAGAARHQP